MDLKSKLESLGKEPHCQNCGECNPQLYLGFEYTSCCNEAICDRLEKYVFTTVNISVRACCWAMAETKFSLQGIDIAKQPGMLRIPINDIDQD